MTSLVRNMLVHNMRVAKKQQGASLLEVMIGLFVLAVGMLGFMGLLTSSLTMNSRSYTLSQAMFMAEEIADRARANRDVITEYGINYSETTAATSTISPNCSTASCTEQEMADWDMAEWMENLQQVLPGSDAEIVITSVAGVTEMKITIQYNLKQGSDNTGDAALLGQLETFQVVTEI